MKPTKKVKKEDTETKEVKALGFVPDEDEKRVVKEIKEMSGIKNNSDIMRLSLRSYHAEWKRIKSAQ